MGQTACLGSFGHQASCRCYNCYSVGSEGSHTSAKPGLLLAQLLMCLGYVPPPTDAAASAAVAAAAATQQAPCNLGQGQYHRTALTCCVLLSNQVM